MNYDKLYVHVTSYEQAEKTIALFMEFGYETQRLTAHDWGDYPYFHVSRYVDNLFTGSKHTGNLSDYDVVEYDEFIALIDGEDLEFDDDLFSEVINNV